MKSAITIPAIAAVMILALLLTAACTPKALEAPATPTETVTSQEAAAAEVPEIAQAEQTVQEIGTEDIDEIDKDLDALVLP